MGKVLKAIAVIAIVAAVAYFAPTLAPALLHAVGISATAGAIAAATAVITAVGAIAAGAVNALLTPRPSAANSAIGTGKTDGSGGAVALFRAGTVDGLGWEDNDAVAGGRTRSALVFLGGVNLNRLTCTDFGNSYDFAPATQNYRPYRTDSPVPLAVGGGFGSIRIDRESQVHFRLAGDSVILPVELPIAGTVGKHVIAGAVGGAGAPLAAGEQNVPRVDARQSDALTKISAQRWAVDGTETNLTGTVKLRVAGSYPAA